MHHTKTSAASRSSRTACTHAASSSAIESHVERPSSAISFTEMPSSNAEIHNEQTLKDF